MSDKKILIFGESGLLGSNLKKHFKNYKVLAPSHKDLDLLNINHAESFISEQNPEFIIYAAGITRIDQAEENKKITNFLNHIVPGKLSKFSSTKKIPFIYISTDAVFDGYKNKYKFSETDKPNPKSTYGKSKLLGENAVLNAGKENCVLRLITLYGNSDKPNFALMMIEKLNNSKEFGGLVDQIRNPILVDIAAEGIKFAVEQNLNGIYHLGSLDYGSNYEFLVKVAKKFNLDKNLIKKNTFDNFIKGKKGHRKKKSVLVCDKFVRVSQNKILKTTDESIEIFYKSMKLSQEKVAA